MSFKDSNTKNLSSSLSITKTSDFKNEQSRPPKISNSKPINQTRVNEEKRTLLKTSYIKLLLSGLICLLFIFIVATILLAIFLSLNIQKKNQIQKDVCVTQNCIKAANYIIQNMNATVDPCENFYEFTCGSFKQNNRIPEDKSGISVFNVLMDKLAYSIVDLLSESIDSSDIESIKNAKNLYSSCMNETKIEEIGNTVLLDIIEKEFDGWPILKQSDEYDSNKTSIINKLITLRKANTPQLFPVYVSSNPKNPKLAVLRVSQPSWFYNRENILSDKIMTAYHTFMYAVIDFFNIGNTNLTKDVSKIFEIEKNFSLLQIDEKYRRNSTYENMTIKDLEKQVPEFEWRDFIFGIFKDVENTTIDENEIILVDDLSYLKQAAKLYEALKQDNLRDLENFFVWLYLKNKPFFLPKKIQDAKMAYDNAVDGRSTKQSRSLSCAYYVNQKMEYAVGRIYISEHFDAKSKNEAILMINNILNVFKQILNESDWLDYSSKKVALEKANSIDQKIGYSDDIFNNTYLDITLYKEYIFDSVQLLRNVFITEKIDVKTELIQLRKEQKPQDWITGPAVVNAFYNPTGNQICFPAGILNFPFYDALNPKYMNYGGIGTVIGHEITHGFDDVGRLYDKEGIFHSDTENITLWSKQTIEAYKERAKCIVDQYTGYIAKDVNKTLNGINTQGENIADNGGIKESFRAYKKWASQNPVEPSLPGLENYSNEQMFFISFGQIWCGKTRPKSLIQQILNDPHSPGEFRIIGSTSNSEDFSKAFNCKPGQNNNPVKKCSVW